MKKILSPLSIPALLLVVSLFASCKKDGDKQIVTLPVTDPAQLLKDSALQYSKEFYLWYKQIPATFKTNSYADLKALMVGLRQYSNEPGFSGPVDQWSFAMKQDEWNNISSGIAGDFGLGVFFYNSDDLRVKYVEKNSPAGKAGICRGWRIKAINGNSNIISDNPEFVVNNVFYSASSTFTFIKPDGSSSDIALNAATYQENPVFLDSVYNYGGKKTGYFVFNSFLGDTASIYDQFQKTFNRFASENISDLIIDLRYNGGGYVSIQEKLANYLAPVSANNALMTKEEFNDKSSRYNTYTYFKKLGTLNLPRIFFIVSGSTASASELLINNLKPFMDVKLIGPRNTFGKPVGFFQIDVGDWYIFPVMFRSTNRNGEGNYFNGLNVNAPISDGLNKDWGDIQESCLASALRFITTGAYMVNVGPRTLGIEENQSSINAGNQILEKPAFKGMIKTMKK